MQGPGSQEDPDQHPVQEPSRAALDPTLPLLPSDSKEVGGGVWTPPGGLC